MGLITPSFGLIFWQTIIFLLMLFILGKFAWKPILNVIETRDLYIEASLDIAKKIRNEMYYLQIIKEHWRKESNIQRDILIRDARNISNFIRLEYLQRYKIYKKKNILHTKCILEKEKETSKSYIKNNIVYLAITISEVLLGKELKNKKEQEYIFFNLIDNSLNAIDKAKIY